MREISEKIISALKKGNKILVCGNGGSSTLASHFAGELVGKFKKDRRALNALSLTDPGIITAIGNDYSFDSVFSRQIEAYGKKGDILITMSTSGKSKNIIEAQNKAKEMGIEVYALPTNRELQSPTDETQEEHLFLIHKISEEVESAFE
jgi:D-sedoheptulose 7-phosphate isomerase